MPNEYELIRDSAAQAGFNVIDGNSPTWGQDLRRTPTLYDASLFGWQSTAVDVAGTNANFVTGGQNNYERLLAAPVVDGCSTSCKASTDPDEQQELLLEIEQNLWADAFGVTIFQHPGITAYNSTYVDRRRRRSPWPRRCSRTSGSGKRPDRLLIRLEPPAATCSRGARPVRRPGRRR